MKQVIAIINVNELPGQDINLDEAVADITLYPNKDSVIKYSERIGRFYDVKVRPLPEKKDVELYRQEFNTHYGLYAKGYNDCLDEILGDIEWPRKNG